MRPGAVILCGGESRRMGRPKAWLPFGGETLLARVARLVGSVAQPVVVVAAPDQPLPPLSSPVRVARDPVRGRGPLQGLAAGLRALPEEVELCYATGTDAPFFQPGWVDLLVTLIGEHDLAIPRSGGRHHPLAALYRRGRTLPEIESLLDADRLRPIFLMERLRTREVTEEELRGADPALLTLRNLNTPEDYHAALAAAGLDLPGDDPIETRAGGAPEPRVRFELFGIPRLRAGTAHVWVHAADLETALRRLALAHPALVGPVLSADGRLASGYTLNLDGRRFVDDPRTPLNDGDSLLLLALDVGG